MLIEKDSWCEFEIVDGTTARENSGLERKTSGSWPLTLDIPFVGGQEKK